MNWPGAVEMPSALLAQEPPGLGQSESSVNGESMRNIKLCLLEIAAFASAYYTLPCPIARGAEAHCAAFGGNVERPKQLYAERPAVLLEYMQGPIRRQPLHCAIEGRQLRAVHWLLDRGADVNSPRIRVGSKSELRLGVLELAIERGDPSLVRLLLERGTNPNPRIERQTPLTFAAGMLEPQTLPRVTARSHF